MPHTLVSFHAHPDDEALLTAGTLARARAEGMRVVVVFATRGDVGRVATGFLADDESLAARRTREALASTEILGVHRVEFLDYGDSGSAAEHLGPTSFAGAPVGEAAAALAVILDEEGAAFLTVYDRHGGYGHPDHLQVRAVGLAAADLAARPPRVLEATINRDLMQLGVEMAAGLGYEVPPEFTPSTFDTWFTPAAEITHTVDVSAFLSLKRSAMAAHASQTTADEGDRTLAAFLSLPDEYFALAFGSEWYVETGDAPDPFLPGPHPGDPAPG